MNRKIISLCTLLACSALLIASFELSAAPKKQLHAKELVSQPKESLESYLDSVQLTSGTTFSTVQDAILDKKMDDPEWLAVLFAYQNGYFLDTKGLGGDTLLHKAIAAKKSAETIRKLIDSGASLTAVNSSGKTARDIYLDKHGADSDFGAMQLLTPKEYFGTDLVKQKPENVQSFLKTVRGSIPQEESDTIFDYTYREILENANTHTDEWLDAFLTFENNRFVRFVAGDEETFLHKAARRKEEAVIRALVRNGADSTKKNIRDFTPLDLYRAKTRAAEAGKNQFIIDLLTPKDLTAENIVPHITRCVEALKTLHNTLVAI